MPEFRIEAMPSRKLDSNRVVYYVKDPSSNKLVTKFNTDIQKAEEIAGWEKFTAVQKLELQNYVANVRFVIDKLQLPAKLNRDYRLSLPDPFQAILVKLLDRARTNQINFDPMTAMLNGLLNHIATTEKRLKTIGEPSVLAEFNINFSHNEKTELDKEIRKYAKKIFKRLLTVPNNLEKYTNVAHECYNKETNLNSTTIAKYAEGKSKPSKWSISCALAVLGNEKDAIPAAISIPLLVSLWLTPLKFAGNLTTAEQAINLFQQIFTLDKAFEQEAIHSIKNEMLKLT